MFRSWREVTIRNTLMERIIIQGIYCFQVWMFPVTVILIIITRVFTAITLLWSLRQIMTWAESFTQFLYNFNNVCFLRIPLSHSQMNRQKRNPSGSDWLGGKMTRGKTEKWWKLRCPLLNLVHDFCRMSNYIFYFYQSKVVKEHYIKSLVKTVVELLDLNKFWA